MQILSTQTIECKKTVYTADWIDGYNDGTPLSSTTMEYESEQERLDGLKEYDKLEIDIDPNRRQYGWEFGHKEVVFHVTVEVIQDDDGNISVRQKPENWNKN